MTELVTYDLSSPEIQYLCAKDKRLAKVISVIGPISYAKREAGDAYAFLVHEIIEQMLSAKAGNAIYRRLEALCGNNVCPDAINRLTDEEIRSIGTANSKVGFIRNLTNVVLSGELCFECLESLPDRQVMDSLMTVKGIGTWTAKMYLLFVLDRKDILPYEDVAFIQSYQWLYKTPDRNAAAIKKKCKKWSPYSSLAARYLYRALDTGLTKEEFHLYKQ